MKKVKNICLLGAVITILVLTAFSCKSHKATTVTPTPQFVTDEEWELVSIIGKDVVYQEGQHKATIHFNPEAGTFGGSNGCNQYFGSFKDLGNGKMALGNFNGTKRACPESFSKLEKTYMQVIHRCDGYRLDAYTLELLQGDKVLLTFEKAIENHSQQ